MPTTLGYPVANNPNDDFVLSEFRRVSAGLTVTKVVCTRSVKGSRGDSFVGFSAQTDSVQEDGTRDLAPTIGDRGGAGMSLRDARIAAMALGLQADLAAHQNAWAGGNISDDALVNSTRTIKSNYIAKAREYMAGGAAPAKLPDDKTPAL